ncbi:hypothetical protein VA249_09640 [Vibrio alfacsensis]|uniref:hypothetical protein n=1 Tax=Vibrio alfacsensis TaxID=1074311 RepID=UPI001BEFF2EB|nr:hypothetical protein [Vibrio alfacsensis]BBM64318.1 hypothetical protein VA249_09640 [Vibrio alfacsensis]
MAQAILFVCTSCDECIESWSDGNPYYIDENGKKRYAYHPEPNFDRCIGNDSPHICLGCAHEFKVDSRVPKTECPKCQSSNIKSDYDVEGEACPYCKKGVFERGIPPLKIS